MLFDNREVFVREFVGIFADQMLQLRDYNVGEIQLRAELLKRRFGERTLQNLDVMVRDIQESKRVDTGVHAESIQGKAVYGTFHASILSKLCWPQLKSEEFLLPSAIESQLSLYGTGFSKLKQRRKLKWLRSLGNVDVELELEDRTVALTVAPEMASFIHAFHDTTENSLEYVQEKLKMSPEMARRCAAFGSRRGYCRRSRKECSVCWSASQRPRMLWLLTRLRLLRLASLPKTRPLNRFDNTGLTFMPC